MRYLLSLLLSALLFACQTPMVASSTGAIFGDIRTDGESWLAVGDIDATVTLRAKGGSLPIAQDVYVPAGEVWIYHESEVTRQPVAEPLPAWAKEFFTQSELDYLSSQGIDLTFDD